MIWLTRTAPDGKVSSVIVTETGVVLIEAKEVLICSKDRITWMRTK